MAGSNGGKKKKTKKKTKPAAQVRRSKLAPEQRGRVEGMYEILGEVWEPFKTAEKAIRGLEADPAPWLELEFWDSLAEAFMRYYGKSITLQVNTRALRRNQRAAAEATAAAESLLLGELRGPPNGSDVSPAREGSNAEEEAGGEGGGEEQPHPTTADEIDGEGLREVEESDGPETEMLQMEAVAHLGRADRLGIIRKTVPFEKRVLALQRLFFLAQASAEEVERLVAGVKELGNNSSAAAIRDVNLLETWQRVREERASAWEAAMEQVRLATDNDERSGTESDAIAAGSAVVEESDAVEITSPAAGSTS